MRARVAEIQRQRVGAVLLADRCEPGVDRLERLVPRHFVERVAPAHERPAHAVGIRLQLLERGALRAEEPVAEHVVTVAAYEGDRPAVEVELEPARRLTQVAGAKSGTRSRRRHGESVRLRRARRRLLPG